MRNAPEDAARQLDRSLPALPGETDLLIYGTTRATSSRSPRSTSAMFPRDPAAPPGETINCGCQSLPWMEDWDVQHPGRREYTPEELALDPRKRDLAGALRGGP